MKIILCPAIHTFQMDLGKHLSHDHGYIDIISEAEAHGGYECISDVVCDDGD